MDHCRSSDPAPGNTVLPGRLPSTSQTGETAATTPSVPPAVAHVPSEDRLAGLDADSLHRLAATQPVIEQAKGMLMAYYGIDADAAFALLNRWSSERHVKVRDLSRRVVEHGSTTHPQPFGALRSLLEEAPAG